MNNPRDLNTLDQLVNSLLLDSILPDDHERLEKLLQENPQALDQYLTHIDLHLALKRVAAEGALARPELSISSQQSQARTSLRGSGKTRFRWILGSALTVLLLVGSGAVYWWNHPTAPRPGLAGPVRIEPDSIEKQSVEPLPVAQVPRSTSPIVSLRQAANAEMLREFVPELGAPLRLQHDYVLVKGMVELDFESGAQTIIQSPAVFSIKSATCLVLKIGSCSVYAPEVQNGFEVITPRNRVVDLGTRFSVAVNDNGNSEVQVVEGAAQVFSNHDDSMVTMLQKGEGGRCSTTAEGFRPVTFDPQQYQRTLPDRVISYDAEMVAGDVGVRDLVSVTVQRGHQPITYPVEDLIGIDVVHFVPHSNRNSIIAEEKVPENAVDLLSRDRALNTGLINFDRDPEIPLGVVQSTAMNPSRSGLGIRFHRPVRNDAGPDVVLFEIQSVVYPMEGDHFCVGPLEPADGLRSHLISSFDITMNTENARKVAPFRVFTFESKVNSLSELNSIPSQRGGASALAFYALAVGIDLSDLGYPEGAEVSGLFFEDANSNPSIVVDPTFIAGFPPLLREVADVVQEQRESELQFDVESTRESGNRNITTAGLKHFTISLEK